MPSRATWGDSELRDLLEAFCIERTPVIKRDDRTAFLQNHALGIELTFRYADTVDVPLRDRPSGTIVLSNIRLYGAGSSTHAAFKGDLPFEMKTERAQSQHAGKRATKSQSGSIKRPAEP